MNSYSRASLFALLFVVISNAVSLLFSAASFLKVDYFWRYVVSSIFAYAIPCSLFLFIASGAKKGLLSFRPLSIKNVMLTALLSFFMQPFLMLVSAASTLLFPNSASAALETFSHYPFWATALCVAILPAVFEELIFRGFVFGSLSNVPLWRALIFSGLLFAMAHMDGQQFLYAFIMGIFFGIIVFKTGSVFASVTAHFTMNFSQSTFAYIAYKNNPAAGDAGPFTLSPLIFMALAVSPILLLLARSFIKTNKAAFPPPLAQNSSERVINIPFLCFLAIYAAAIISQLNG